LPCNEDTGTCCAGPECIEGIISYPQ
jgi:hypothetical protein